MIKRIIISTILTLIPTVAFSQDLDNLVEDTVNNNPEVQQLQSRIKVLDNQIQRENPFPVLRSPFPNPIINKLQILFYPFTPTAKLEREKERLENELEVLKLGIAEEVIEGY